MAAIKNIIFDLGGVLLDIDYQLTAAAFKKLGVRDFDDFFSQQQANQLFEDLETGTVSEADFYANMLLHCQSGTTEAAVKHAWNAILQTFRLSSLQYLPQLKNKYNIYLLSNTNSIHLTAFNEIFTMQTGQTNFDAVFKKAYYSHLINKRKPYTATYQWVLNDAGIEAASTLFIDDSKVNIQGALEAGLATHWLQKNQQIENLGL
jgi:glucose-1-phosphatase